MRASDCDCPTCEALRRAREGGALRVAARVFGCLLFVAACLLLWAGLIELGLRFAGIR